MAEIVVDVRAAAANFPDLLLMRNAYQYRCRAVRVPGGEIAGVVMASPSALYGGGSGLGCSTAGGCRAG